jgi:F-type H+-transporting ATPase subunit b
MLRLFKRTVSSEPRQVAAALIDKFPGKSLAAKSSSILIGASIASYLVSKEIYVIDAEFFEMLCLFGAYGILYNGGKDAALAYFQGKRDVCESDSDN